MLFYFRRWLIQRLAGNDVPIMANLSLNINPQARDANLISVKADRCLLVNNCWPVGLEIDNLQKDPGIPITTVFDHSPGNYFPPEVKVYRVD